MSSVSAYPAAVVAPASTSPWAWFAAGVLGAAALGAGGASVYLNHQATPAPAVAAVVAPAAAAPLASVAPVAVAPVAPAPAHSQKKKITETSVNSAQRAPKSVATERPVLVADNTPPAVRSEPVVEQPQPRQVCGHCGTVEAVTPIAVEAKPSGVGAVAGAVLGGLLGNQFGGGDGKTLATIGGLVGGAYAGNTVEKRMNQQTSYRVLVRMDDGSSRSVEQNTPSVGVGSRVTVQGNVLSPAGSAYGQGT